MADLFEYGLRNVMASRQVENTMAQQVAIAFNDAASKLEALLHRMDPTSVSTAKQAARLKALELRANTLIQNTYQKLQHYTEDALTQFGVDFSKGLTGQLDELIGQAGVAIGTKALGRGFFRAILLEDPLQGAPVREWWAKQSKAAQFGFRREVRMGLTQHEPIADIVRRVRGKAIRPGVYKGGVMGTSTREATALVRTATNQIANRAAFDTYAANQDVTTAYRFVATLDDRTTPICMSLDGKTFRYDDEGAKRPPLHWACRSTIMPIVDWDKLGLKGPKAGTRAAKGGPVSAGVNYESWLKAQPAAMQNRILGVGRAKLFRAGKVTLGQLIRKDGRLLPLKDVQAQLLGIAPAKWVTPPPGWHLTTSEWHALSNQQKGAVIKKLKAEALAKGEAWPQGAGPQGIKKPKAKPKPTGDAGTAVRVGTKAVEMAPEFGSLEEAYEWIIKQTAPNLADDPLSGIVWFDKWGLAKKQKFAGYYSPKHHSIVISDATKEGFEKWALAKPGSVERVLNAQSARTVFHELQHAVSPARKIGAYYDHVGYLIGEEGIVEYRARRMVGEALFGEPKMWLEAGAYDKEVRCVRWLVQEFGEDFVEQVWQAANHDLRARMINEKLREWFTSYFAEVGAPQELAQSFLKRRGASLVRFMRADPLTFENMAKKLRKFRQTGTTPYGWGADMQFRYTFRMTRDGKVVAGSADGFEKAMQYRMTGADKPWAQKYPGAVALAPPPVTDIAQQALILNYQNVEHLSSGQKAFLKQLINKGQKGQAAGYVQKWLGLKPKPPVPPKWAPAEHQLAKLAPGQKAFFTKLYNAGLLEDAQEYFESAIGHLTGKQAKPPKTLVLTGPQKGALVMKLKKAGIVPQKGPIPKHFFSATKANLGKGTLANLEMALSQQGLSYTLDDLIAIFEPSTTGIVPKPVAKPPVLKTLAKKKTLDEAQLMHQKVGGQLGTNPGGVYVGSDGVKRYVKIYANPAQAYNEELANAIYRECGIAVPETGTVVLGDGRVALWTRYLEGADQLGSSFTAQQARVLLEAMPVDALLANWDAVGTQFQNIVKYKGKLVRIDQGGSLLFRAQGKLKPSHLLMDLGEWQTMALPEYNAYYAKLFEKVRQAGIKMDAAEDLWRFKNAIEATQRIVNAYEANGGTWEPFVNKIVPLMGAEDRALITKMLNARTAILKQKLAMLKQAVIPGQQAPPVLKLKAKKGKAPPTNLPTDVDWNSLTKYQKAAWSKKCNAAAQKGLEVEIGGGAQSELPLSVKKLRNNAIRGTQAEETFKKKWPDSAPFFTEDRRHALRYYRTDGYSDINGVLRRGKKPSNKYTKPDIDLIDELMQAQKVPDDTIVYRGIHTEEGPGAAWIKSLIKAAHEDRAIGTIIEDKGYFSTTLKRETGLKFAQLYRGTDAGFVLEVRVPKGKGAAYMDSLFDHIWEHELLLERNTKWRIVAQTRRTHQGHDYWHFITEPVE